MRFHDLSCDKETEAGAALTLGGEKRLENPRQGRWSNTGSGIGYRNPDGAFGDSGIDGKNTRMDIHHGIGGVLEKVDQRLNHLPAVESNQGQALIQMDLHIDKLNAQIRMHEPERIRNHFGKPAGLGLRTSRAAKVEHAFRQFLDTQRGTLDHFEIGAKWVTSRETFLEKADMTFNE